MVEATESNFEAAGRLTFGQFARTKFCTLTMGGPGVGVAMALSLACSSGDPEAIAVLMSNPYFAITSKPDTTSSAKVPMSAFTSFGAAAFADTAADLRSCTNC